MASTSTSSISATTTTTTTSSSTAIATTTASTASNTVSTITNSPTSSSNSNTTSSSDKTKLSTSSALLNESQNLNNSAAEQASSSRTTPTHALAKSPSSRSPTPPAIILLPLHSRSAKHDAGDGENIDDSDVDTLTLGLEAEVKNVAGLNHKNQPDHKNYQDEELNEFSSSLSISTLSTASSSGGDIIQKHRVGTTTASAATPSDMNTNAHSPNNPTNASTSSRKREHNRRKSSDPVSMKKLPRLLESDDDLQDDCRIDEDDDEDLMEDDYDLLDEQEEEEDDTDDFNYDSRRNNISMKASSILFHSNNSNMKPGMGLSSTTSKGSRGQGSLRSRPYDFVSGTADAGIATSEEKLINSSNEEYETSITRSEIVDSHYNIRWKNHQTHILLAFESLLQNETFCDVTLICDDDLDEEGDNDKDSKDSNEDQHTLKGQGEGGLLKLRAHKIVLSACSEYFQRIFAENPCKHPVIVLKDYQAWEIQALLDFMYRGEVDVSLEKLASLVKSAESLQIRGLTDSLGKLGPDLFKPNQAYLSKSTCSKLVSNNSNNKTKTHPPPTTTTRKSYADNSSGRGRKAELPGDQGQEGFLSLNRIDTGALNLSMDLKIQKRSSHSSRQEIELPMRNRTNMLKANNNMKINSNIMTRKPQNLNLSIVETSMLQIQKDKDSLPTTTSGTGTGGSGAKATTTNHHNIRHHHHHHLNHHNHNHHLLPEDHGQNSCNDEEGEMSQNHPEDFHTAGTRQNLLPRRKQARPRRRSGDYIAQDLRKVMSSLNQTLPHNMNQQTFDLLNLQTLQNLRGQDDDESNGKLEITLSREDPDSQYQHVQQHQQEQGQSPHRDNPLHHHHHHHHHAEDRDRDDGSPTSRREGTVMMTRLAQRRRSSRRNNQDRDRDLNPTSPMNLRNANKRSNSNNNNIEDDNNGMETTGERIIDEEELHHQNRVLDYTTRASSPGNKKLKIRGITQGLHFPGQSHLPFLRNWSPTLGNNLTPPPGHQRISPMKHEGDSDDGISSTADQCPSPPLSPTVDPKHFLSRHLNNHNSPHDFPLFGLHPDHPHSLQRSNNLNLVGSLQFNKQSPPSPSNFFLGPLGSMSITPIGGGGGSGGGDRDDSRAGTPSTPPNVFSPAGFPLQLPLALTSGNNHGGHLNHNHHHHHGGKEDRDGERTSRGGGGKDGTRGSPVGWPGLSLGPPPIFGRHRAQHSAPRGGPPRAWSNADLTEALHNVWNKKMTTSQASRIFGIPYNSLLMYVRGKYGKSLKLDLLKKGLDQAMENSQNSANNANSNNNTTTNTTSPPVNASSASSTNNNNSNISNANPSTNTNSTTSPTHNLGISITSTTNSNNSSSSTNNNNNNSSSSVKGHSNISSHLLSNHSSEHNNNNSATAMGHLHHHLQNLHNHQQQQHHHHKSSKSHERVGLELPHELPPGFNPFTAASIFGEYPSPFPFASALSHILPQASLVNQHGLGHPGLGLSLNHSGRNDKVSVGDDEK